MQNICRNESFEKQADEKICLCGVIPGHAGADVAFFQGQTLLRTERCRSLKISCQLKKQDKYTKTVEIYSK
jgi:hypothetical protein